MNETRKPKSKPEFRNLNLFHDVAKYRLPLAGWSSILHRVSGAIMFLLLPLAIWLFDKSLSSELSYEKIAAVFDSGWGWFIKLVLFVLLWAFWEHTCSGIRHFYLELTHVMTKDRGRHTAVAVFVTAGILTLISAVVLLF